MGRFMRRAVLPLCVLVASGFLSARAAAQEAPKVAGVDVPAPKRTKTVMPEYPPEAQSAGIRGIVILELVIDTEGHVSSADVVRSIPSLDEAALAAVRKWEYEVTKVDGRPVSVRLTVPISFALKLPEVSRQDGVPELQQGVAPAYPAAQRDKAATVVAEVTLDSRGSVADALVTSGDSPWADALLGAIRTWRFAVDDPGAAIAFRVEARFVPGAKSEVGRVELRLTDPRRSKATASQEVATTAPGPPQSAPAAPPAAQPAAQPTTPAAAPPATQPEAPTAAPPATQPPAAAAPPSPGPTKPPAAPAATQPAAPPPGPVTPPRAEPQGPAAAPAAAQPPPPSPAPATPSSAAPPPRPPAAATPPAAPTAAPPPTTVPPTPAPAPSPAAAPATGGSAPPSAPPTPSAPATNQAPGSSQATRLQQPPTEILSVPPPKAPEGPPENGVSAVRDITLSPGVPDLVKGRRPVVPPFARIEGATGKVRVRFSVSAAGIVSVQGSEGPDVLRHAAEDATSTWSFRRASAVRLHLVANFDYRADGASAAVSPDEAPPQ